MANTPWNGNCSGGERSKAKVPSVEGGFSGTTLSGTSRFSLVFVHPVVTMGSSEKIKSAGVHGASGLWSNSKKGNVKRGVFEFLYDRWRNIITKTYGSLRKETFILCFVSIEYSYSFVRNFTKSKNQASDKRTHSRY